LRAPTGVALYALLALLPLALAVPLKDRPVMDEVASSLGLVAFAIALLEFALSGRYRRVSGRIGVDRTLRVHRVVAYTMVGLIALHPFLYTDSDDDRRFATAPWFTGSEPSLGLAPLPLWTGTAAWLLVAVLVVTAVDRTTLPCRYETWRRLHAAGAGVATALVAVHAFTAGGYSGELPLAPYWAALLAGAGASLGYGYLLQPWRQTAHPYRVDRVLPVGAHSWELRLRPRDGRGLAYRPGQFAWVKLGGAFAGVEHPFSISTAPSAAPEIGFVIKEKGDFTNAIGQVPPGTPAYLDGPHGHFVPDESPVPSAYVAVGTGIGPVLSHLRAFADARDGRPLTLIYAAETPDALVCRDELTVLARTLDLASHLVVRTPDKAWTGHVGEIDGALLAACLPAHGRASSRYFVCGPPTMMATTARTLRRLGVPRRRIVTGS
jgi:predicted ferric reductase